MENRRTSHIFYLFNRLGLKNFFARSMTKKCVVFMTLRGRYSLIHKKVGFSNIAHVTSDSKNFKPEYFTALIA